MLGYLHVRKTFFLMLSKIGAKHEPNGDTLISLKIMISNHKSYQTIYITYTTKTSRHKNKCL